MKQVKHIYLFWALQLIFGLLLIQGTLDIPKEKSLNGSTEIRRNPDINLADWFDGTFQINKEKWLKQHFGFRNFFTRLGNTIDFFLFERIHTNSIIRGKAHCYYEDNYVKAFTGRDYLGRDSIEHLIQMIKNVSDSFAIMQKQFIVVYAPGKASLFPEFIPDSFPKNVKNTNYHTFIEFSKRDEIHYLDFNQWFIQRKENDPNPVYAHGGIHWSNYGMCLAADSLLKYIGTIRQQPIPHASWTRIDKKTAIDIDIDIVKSFNLFYYPYHEEMSYPNITFQKDSHDILLNALVISDSYYWGLWNLGISKAFNYHEFWYYNEEKHSPSTNKNQIVDKTKMLEMLKNFDVIIILCTEANLSKLGWGAIQECYAQFHHFDTNKFKNPIYYKKVYDLKNYIKTDLKWMVEIKRKALEKDLSIDSMTMLDAIYIIDQQK